MKLKDIFIGKIVESKIIKTGEERLIGIVKGLTRNAYREIKIDVQWCGGYRENIFPADLMEVGDLIEVED